ncbi:GNAT family N-acetyltransferase [Rhodopseudomonas pseudopalustris]|uniref:GNAT family N-acetyltransferase n=1 Tax=Rhodopseudomonas pseudopalustris TaxID=1513892 RepID=UPI001FCDCDD4|nr:GNAT family N-acetyltransferase [Rhodopseudomonas pseudopalustris]
MTPSDLERVVEIDRDNTGHARRGFFENRLTASLNEPNAFISLAYIEHDRVEGFVLAHMLDGEFGGSRPATILDAIGIAQSARGHGGAHGLLRELQAKARRRDALEVRTQVVWSDQAMTHFFAGLGFRLGTRLVLERDCAMLPDETEAQAEPGEDLSRDRIAVRSMAVEDLHTVIGLDRRITGRDRSTYYQRKMGEALRKNGIRLSMLAEIDQTPAGFVMARVDYGEFGQTELEAVLDTIGVDAEFRTQGVGSFLLAQLLSHLASLRVDRVRTVVNWNDVTLIGFFDRLGFRPTQNVVLALDL